MCHTLRTLRRREAEPWPTALTRSGVEDHCEVACSYIFLLSVLVRVIHDRPVCPRVKDTFSLRWTCPKVVTYSPGMHLATWKRGQVKKSHVPEQRPGSK